MDFDCWCGSRSAWNGVDLNPKSIYCFLGRDVGRGEWVGKVGAGIRGGPSMSCVLLWPFSLALPPYTES